MIPGKIEEWKAALASSKPGVERGACLYALAWLGVKTECRTSNGWISNGAWIGMDQEHRVKPTPRPWNADDALRHVGFAYRIMPDESAWIVSERVARNPNADWSDAQYATPIPGTDPSTWNWKKCEVVE